MLDHLYVLVNNLCTAYHTTPEKFSRQPPPTREDGFREQLSCMWSQQGAVRPP